LRERERERERERDLSEFILFIFLLSFFFTFLICFLVVSPAILSVRCGYRRRSMTRLAPPSYTESVSKWRPARNVRNLIHALIRIYYRVLWILYK
jgi:hypothetical protein